MTAQKGRTHDCKRPLLITKKTLASRGPSTHEAAFDSKCGFFLYGRSAEIFVPLAALCSRFAVCRWFAKISRHRRDDPWGSRRRPSAGFWRILLKKSKIERLRKSREGQFLSVSAAASLCRAGTKVSARIVRIDVVPHVAARGTPQRG
jgi:hypothetical protein